MSMELTKSEEATRYRDNSSPGSSFDSSGGKTRKLFSSLKASGTPLSGIVMLFLQYLEERQIAFHRLGYEPLESHN